MSPQDRIEALKAKHAELERAIDEENRRPLPNRDAVSDLKRQKLRIKDEIFSLEQSVGHCDTGKSPARIGFLTVADGFSITLAFPPLSTTIPEHSAKFLRPTATKSTPSFL